MPCMESHKISLFDPGPLGRRGRFQSGLCVRRQYIRRNVTNSQDASTTRGYEVNTTSTRCDRSSFTSFKLDASTRDARDRRRAATPRFTISFTVPCHTLPPSPSSQTFRSSSQTHLLSRMVSFSVLRHSLCFTYHSLPYHTSPPFPAPRPATCSPY